MALINHIVSFIIMILIPTIVYTGIDLFYKNSRLQKIQDERSEYAELNNIDIFNRNYNDYPDEYKELDNILKDKTDKIMNISSYIGLFIGITILFSSIYFNIKIWGIPLGGSFLIISYILFMNNNYVRFFILILLLFILVLFLTNKKYLKL
tara:strand:+ start:1049 stop:1501 length:453 start_codon:yes stop_codon:yes gene_type:complete